MLLFSRMDEIIQVKTRKFVVKSVKAEHPDHTTYICVWADRTYCVRTYKEGYDQALADYKELKHAGINMAKMCFHDEATKSIVFDYFPEEDCLKALSHGPLSDEHFSALFDLYRFARFSKVALDWQPQNFMLRGSQMFYLPTKWEPLTDDKRLEKGFLRTWFLGSEGRALLKKKGYDVSELPSLSEQEVNKATVLMTVKNW